MTKRKLKPLAANADSNYQKIATRLMVSMMVPTSGPIKTQASSLPVKKAIPNTQMKYIQQLERLRQPTTYGILPDLMRATPEQLLAFADAFAVAKNGCMKVGDYARASKFDKRERFCQLILRGMTQFTLG